MSLLTRTGIGAKIYSIVFILSAITLSFAYYMGNTLTNVNKQYSDMFDNDVRFALTLERMRGDVANMGRQLNNVLLLQDPASLPSLTKAISDIQGLITTSQDGLMRLSKPEHKAIVTQMNNLIVSVANVLPRIYALKEKADHAGAAALYGKEGRPLVVETFNIAAKLSDEVSANVDKISDQLTVTVDHTTLMSTITVVVMIALAALLSIVIAVFGIRRPISTLNSVMGRLAQGDATVTVEGRERADEVGSMARTVEVFKENLLRSRKMEQEVKETQAQAAVERRKSVLDLAQRFEDRVGGIVNAVGSAATELQTSSSQLAAAAEEVNAQCISVATASEQASANVQTVASASEEMSSSIRQLSERVNLTAGRSKAAASGAEQAQHELNGLANAIEQVDQIVAAINSVAAQTNLLALNATIEAARAGDAGKGFAVVASEVKNLANQTHAMTEQISTNLANVKGASNKTVEAMLSIIAQVADIDRSTAEMAESVDQQSSATREISHNAQQASTGATEVSRNIGGIQHAGSETSAATNNVKRAADHLAEQSAMLKRETNNFLTEIRSA